MSRVTLERAASLDAINQVADELGRSLPQDYVAFLLHSNGAEGSVGRFGYLRLWRIEEIVGSNRAYRLDDEAHALLMFGTDGGGEAYAFDFGATPPVVVEVPFEVLGDDAFLPRVIAHSFTAFVECMGDIHPLYRRENHAPVTPAMESLGVTIPASVRRFYELNEGPFASKTIGYALLDACSGKPTIADVTRDCRDAHGWPLRLIALTELLGGAILVLDAETGAVCDVDFEGGDVELLAGRLNSRWASFETFLDEYFRE